jgi:methionine-rich copper-binding protein CopC
MITMRPLLTLLLLLGFVSLAQAHAFLDSAEPKVGSTVAVSPTVVKIWFTKQIVREGSTIGVFNAQGTEVDRKDNVIAPDNRFLLSVTVPKLPTGPYKVIWNAICRDTHHTTGNYIFTVAP